MKWEAHWPFQHISSVPLNQIAILLFVRKRERKPGFFDGFMQNRCHWTPSAVAAAMTGVARADYECLMSREGRQSQSFKVPAFYYEGGPRLQLMTTPWLIDIRREKREKKALSESSDTCVCSQHGGNLKKVIKRKRQGKTNWTNICLCIYFMPYVSSDAWAWLVEVQSATRIWIELGWNPGNKDMCQVFHCQFWATWTWDIRERKWGKVPVCNNGAQDS